jgi:ribulose-phosphate 3-epimerase
MKVIPTLLTTTNTEFIQQLATFQQYFNRIQLDIADGELVANKTTSISDMISLWKDGHFTIVPGIEFDFHLMVKDYKKNLEDIEKLQKMGMKVHTVLINATLKPQIDVLKDMYDFSVGLDIFPHVAIKDIEKNYTLENLDEIQIMTVEPGFQGAPFLEKMLHKITLLREIGYKKSILIDGGVNAKTLPIICTTAYTPDFLCIGSYLTKAGDKLEERIKDLQKTLKAK